MEKQKVIIPSENVLSDYCANSHNCENCVFWKRLSSFGQKHCLQNAFIRFKDACKQFEEVYRK